MADPNDMFEYRRFHVNMYTPIDFIFSAKSKDYPKPPLPGGSL